MFVVEAFVDWKSKLARNGGRVVVAIVSNHVATQLSIGIVEFTQAAQSWLHRVRLIVSRDQNQETCHGIVAHRGRTGRYARPGRGGGQYAKVDHRDGRCPACSSENAGPNFHQRMTARASSPGNNA